MTPNTSPGVPLTDEELARWTADNEACVQPSETQRRLLATIQAERTKFATLVASHKITSEAVGASLEISAFVTAKVRAAESRATTAEALCVELRGRVAELEARLNSTQ